MKQNKVQPQAPEKQDRKRYEAPAVIYESAITTRAGSPLGSDGIDPADLFGD